MKAVDSANERTAPGDAGFLKRFFRVNEFGLLVSLLVLSVWFVAESTFESL